LAKFFELKLEIELDTHPGKPSLEELDKKFNELSLDKHYL
jgi:hypothetical protein